MSKVSSLVKPDLTMLSANSQERLIRTFLPAELIPAGWVCQQQTLIENIQDLYENSGKTIQLYGSPESFEKILMNYMSFPGNQQFFQFSDSVFYKTYVGVYQSLGSVPYIFKKDIYDILLDFAPAIDTLAPLQKLGQNLLAYYLRMQQNKLTTLHEMVGCNREFMQSLNDEKRLVELKMESEEWKEAVATTHVTNAIEVLNLITLYFSKCGILATFEDGMLETFISVTKDLPVEKNVSEYRKMVLWIGMTLCGYMELIDKNRLMMLSRSETVDSMPILKIPIRIFEIKQEKKVMSHELLHAIKLEKLDVSGFEDKILAMPKLSTMDFREVFEIVPNNIFKRLEFVKVPLKTSSRVLSVIPTIDGNHCITAYQFLQATFSDMILVRKLFQSMKPEQWSPIMKELCGLLTMTLTNESDFISYKSYEKTTSLFGAWFKKQFPSPDVKEISNVNKNGFTSKDLKNQLERLEINKIFRNIGTHAYSMPENPPTNGCAYEATKQMLNSIQDCQFSFVFSSLTNELYDNIHERKWCGSLIPKDYCPICTQKQNDEPSVKKVADSKVPVESRAVEEEETHPEDTTSSPEGSSSDETSESSSTESSDNSPPDSFDSSHTLETVVVEKPELVRKSEKTKTKKSGKSAQKPEVKESQSCPKCIRASEYTVKTNEKLRLSKIEVKHLRKELSVVELALEKKEKRIRILEEKLREKENQLSLKNSEVETLITKKQELEHKNGRNDRLIATFHEVNSKKDIAIKSWQCHNYEKDKLIKELMLKEQKATPPRSTEESDKVDSLLSTLMETKTILSKEDPVKKSSDICDSLISKVNFNVTQQLVKYETKVFQLQVSSYSQIVESNIKLIRGNQTIKFDQIPEIPDFPDSSIEFKDVYKSVMKKEAPLLCRQLLKLTDEIADMECVICITDMESHDDTTKCAHCKRRYHNHCIKAWLKTKRICPTCKHGMVDEQEFPPF